MNLMIKPTNQDLFYAHSVYLKYFLINPPTSCCRSAMTWRHDIRCNLILVHILREIVALYPWNVSIHDTFRSRCLHQDYPAECITLQSFFTIVPVHTQCPLILENTNASFVYYDQYKTQRNSFNIKREDISKLPDKQLNALLLRKHYNIL